MESNHFEIQQEMLDLAIKAGRRASYDLRHAVSHIDSPEWANLFYDRAQMWLDIFDLDSGIKDYRHTLHKKIDKLESENNRLKRLLKENGIEDPEEIPF